MRAGLKRPVWMLVLALSAGRAEALSLELERTIAFRNASGVAFDAATGHLWVVDGRGRTNKVTEITTAGARVSVFNSGLKGVQDVALLPNGHLLLPHTNPNGVQEFTRTGAPLTSGVNFTTVSPMVDLDGLAYDPVTGNLFLASDDKHKIFQVTKAGTELSRFDTTSIVAGFTEPEGVTVNPWNGNLWIVDDGDIGNGFHQRPGTSSLYEVTRRGELVYSLNLLDLTGLSDPEGIAIDRVAMKVYIAFDRQHVVGVFGFGDQSSTAAVASAVVPEPEASTVLWAGAAVGLLVLVARRWSLARRSAAVVDASVQRSAGRVEASARSAVMVSPSAARSWRRWRRSAIAR